MLGPLLYFLYTSRLSVISNRPGIQCHFYADDTQIYLSFSPEFASPTFSIIEYCIRDVFSWMISNKLSVNPNKTEYLLFNPNNVNILVNIIILGSNTISPSDSAKNLGVIFQTDMSLENTSHLLLNLASSNFVISVAFVLLSLKQLLSQ